MPDNRQIFFDALKSTGLTSEQALGALWSLGGESGGNLNTGAYNPNDPGGSVGVGQWNGSRRWALEEIARRLGKPVTDPNVQARYLVGELTGDLQGAVYQPGVLDALKQAKTPQEAARIWTAKFERPTVDNSDQRISKGGQVGTLDANGNFVLGTASAAPIPTGAPPTAVAGSQTPKQTPYPGYAPPSPEQQLGMSLGQELGGMSYTGVSGGSGGMADPVDQPAIRSMAAETDFAQPHNPLPAQYAGGAVASQLGALAAQPNPSMLEDPNRAPSITQGAPGMTSMLGVIGDQTPPNPYDPRGFRGPNPNTRVPRLA